MHIGSPSRFAIAELRGEMIAELYVGREMKWNTRHPLGAFPIWLLSICITITSIVYAEGDHTSAIPSSTSSEKRRRAEPSSLRNIDLQVLSSAFSLPVEFLERRYQNSLPGALTKMARGSEASIGNMISELFGTQNSEQVKDLVKKLSPELQKAANEEPLDATKVDLLSRILWGGQILLNPKSEINSLAYAKFREVFEKGQSKVDDENREFREKLVAALDGDEAAQKFLLTQYDLEGLYRFKDAQRKSGNIKIANDLERALELIEKNTDLKAALENTKASLPQQSSVQQEISNAIGRALESSDLSGFTNSFSRNHTSN